MLFSRDCQQYLGEGEFDIRLSHEYIANTCCQYYILKKMMYDKIKAATTLPTKVIWVRLYLSLVAVEWQVQQCFAPRVPKSGAGKVVVHSP